MGLLIVILIFLYIFYFLTISWVIIGFLKLKMSANKPLGKKNYTPISLILPVRNEENNILNCLLSIQNQNFPSSNFEVIIVDDHSSDNSISIISNFISNSQLDIKLLSLTTSFSKKEALKLAIKNASYSIIASTDADCILPSNWLDLISNLLHHDNHMLLGPISFKSSSGFLSAFQVLDMLALQGVEFGSLGFNKPILNNAANLAYLKSTYSDVKGIDDFETPSGDDIFLLEKFLISHKNIIGLLRKDFIVETNTQNTIKDLFHQRIRWASKSKFYTNKLLLFFSFIILLQNISLLFLFIGLLISENYRISFAFLIFSKWLIDFILLFLLADFFNKKNALFYFIPVQVIYPIYIIVVWVASLTMKFEWKERKFNG